MENLGISENLKMVIFRAEKCMKLHTIFEMCLKGQDMSVIEKKVV